MVYSHYFLVYSFATSRAKFCTIQEWCEQIQQRLLELRTRVVCTGTDPPGHKEPP